MRAEIETRSEESKKKVQQEIDTAHVEVRKRVDEEFKTDQITALVRTAAKERVEGGLKGVIQAEVATGIKAQEPTIKLAVETETKKEVNELQPTISAIVRNETEGQINKAVDPVRDEMRSYSVTIKFTKLATLAKNGDRKAFDELNNRTTYVGAPEMMTFGETTVKDIALDLESTVRLQRDFLNPTTAEQMKELAERAPDVNVRLTALDHFPVGDHSIVPVLVRVINNDNNLRVVYTALQVFNRETKQTFRFAELQPLNAWWEQNKSTWK
jgi:hypothetical protein